MTVASSEIPLLLFAKAPIAGKVKTRLQPDCTAAQAAEVAEILLQETVRVANSGWPGKLLLSVWPDADHPVLQDLAQRYDIEIVRQVEGNLGYKMHAALQQYGYPAAVMGCDVPHIKADVLHLACEVLSQGHNIIGPSHDGGYYLLGLSQPVPLLFEGIEWGCSSVYPDTCERASRAGVTLQTLPGLNDIDTWQDVLSCADHLPVLHEYLVKLQPG